MLRTLSPLTLAALALAGGATVALAEDKPIVIGITAPIQLQVGRDTVDATQLAIDEGRASRTSGGCVKIITMTELRASPG